MTTRQKVILSLAHMMNLSIVLLAIFGVGSLVLRIPIWISAIVVVSLGFGGGIKAPLNIALGKDKEHQDYSEPMRLSCIGFYLMWLLIAPMYVFTTNTDRPYHRFTAGIEERKAEERIQELLGELGTGETLNEVLSELEQAEARLLLLFADVYAGADERERLEVIEDMSDDDFWEYLEFYEIVIRLEESEALYARIASDVQTQTDSEIPDDLLRMENRHLLLQWLADHSPEN